MMLRAVMAGAAVLLCAGCRNAAPTHAVNNAAALVTTPTNTPPTTARAKQPSGSESAKEKSASPASATTADSAQLAAILQEVQQAGALDAAAQQALMEDLQKTDPALWPQLVQVFKASVAYRKQTAERIARESAASLPAGETFAAAASPTSPQQPPTSTAASTAVAAAETTPVPLPMVEDGALPPQIPFASVAAAYPSEAISTVQLASASEPTRSNAEPTSASTSTSENTEKSTPSPHDADAHLTAAIRAWEAAAEQQQNSNAPEVNSAAHAAARDRLRLLYLAANRRDDALKSVAGLPGAEQEFWSEQLFGLATLLDADALPDETRRAATAARHLREAADKLSQTAPLGLKNLAFCTEVTSYGVYKPFAKYEFKPGQELLLYAEVENFVSEATAKGFRTALKSSYHILDSRGARVAEQEFALTEEHCRNPRRDFFIRYFIYLPKRIYNGDYTLQLTIEDTLGNKVGQSNIALTIAGEE